MNIQVRVMTAQAMAQLKSLSAADRAVAAQMAGSAGAAGAGAAGVASLSTKMSAGSLAMMRWGNTAQWAGRQMMYNFTLPIALAGGAAINMALDNEKAMVRVQKVYGDATHGSQFYRKEIEALGRAFEALSNQYGIARADVINIAADWAAAGASGLALAKSTKLTMDTMILGEMNAADATQALISIQAQYGQSIDELSTTIDILNMIENQTGITMQGLILGFQRSAGVARTAGIDVRHLGAMLAALVPSSGSAQQAGNALKTMISRLMSPTRDAAGVMKLMGINIKDQAVESMNGTQRLELMAKAWSKLSDAQKISVATTLASRFQINKFAVLMNDMNNKTGYYWKALQSTSSATADYKQKVQELNQVLQSNPSKLQQIWTIMKNLLTDIFVPMIPILVSLAGTIINVFNGFNNLNPATQKMIGIFLLWLALIGPILRYGGSLVSVVGWLGEAIAKLTPLLVGMVGWLLKLALAPFKLIFTGIMGIGAAFLSLGGYMAAGLLGGLKFVLPLFAGIGTVLLAPFKVGWMAFVAAGRVLITQTVVLFGALFSTGFAFMGRNLSVIWGAMFTSLRGITLAGGGVLSAAWTAVSVGLVATWGIVSRGIVGIWAGTQLILTAAFSRFAAIIPLLFSGFATATAAAGSTAVAVWSATTTAMVRVGAALPVMFVGLAKLPFMLATGVATAGPAIMTALTTLGANIGRFFSGIWLTIKVSVALIGPAMLSAWVAAIAAVLGVLYLFRDQIAAAWTGIVNWFQANASALAAPFQPIVNFFWSVVDAIKRAFYSLPAAVQSAFLTVVNIVASAARQVYEWMSYLNPWATHSPSLVDNVKTGMEAVVNYWKNALAVANNYLDQQQAVLDKLNKGLDALTQSYDAHKQAISDLASTPITGTRAADDAIFANDIEQKKLQLAMLKAGSSVKPGPSADAIAISANDMEQKRLQLEILKMGPSVKAGPSADEVAISANDVAQKRLQLEILKMGPSGNIDKLRSQYSALAGDIEMARGAQTELRKAGAGSDITGFYDSQISVLKAQQDAINQSTAPLQGLQDALDELQSKGQILQLEKDLKDLTTPPVADPLQSLQDALDELQRKGQILQLEKDMKDLTQPPATDPLQPLQDALDELQRKGQILQLEKDLQFDPLNRQIEQLSTGMNEIPFEKIVSGIKGHQDAMAALTPQINAATTAVNNQKTYVDSLTAARDALSIRYDAENIKLQQLNDIYDAAATKASNVTSSLKDMTKATDDAAAAAKKAGGGGKADSLTVGQENFKAAAGGNYPDVAGTGKQIGREGGLPDQTALIDEWTKKNTHSIADSFAKMDMFAPIKDMWNSTWAWITKNVGAPIGKVIDAFKSGFSGINWSSMFNFNGFMDRLGSISDEVSNWWNTSVWPIIEMFAPDFQQIWGSIADAGKRVWDDLGPAFAGFAGIFKDILPLLQNLWDFLKPILGVLGTLFLFVLKVATSILANIVRPILNAVIDILEGVIRAIRGIIEFIVGVFSGDWGMAWQGIVDIFGGVWDAIKGVVLNIGPLLWGIVQGIVEGIVGFFTWLGPKVLEIIGSLVTDIVGFFIDLPGNIINALSTLKDKLGEAASSAWNWYWSTMSDLWGNHIIPWVTGLPQMIIDGITGLKDKLGTVASDAWNWYWTTMSNLWGNSIIPWIKGLPQMIVDGITGLRDKLGTVASDAWNWYWSTMSNLWVDHIIPWIQGLPQRIIDGITGLKDKLGTLASDAWNWWLDTAKALWVDHIIPWIQGLPQKIVDAISGLKDLMGTVGIDAFNAFLDKVKVKWEDIKPYLTDFPNKVHDALDGLRDKVGTNATEAFQNFKDKAKIKNDEFIAYLKDFPNKAYDALVKLKDRIGANATEAFQNFKDKAKIKNDEFIAYAKDFPDKAHDALAKLKDKIGANATEAFQAFKDKAKEKVDEFIAYVKTLPQKVADELKNLPQKIEDALKPKSPTQKYGPYGGAPLAPEAPRDAIVKQNIKVIPILKTAAIDYANFWKSFWSGLGSAIKTVATLNWDISSTIVEVLGQTVIGIWGAILETGKKIATGLWNGFTQKTSEAWNGIQTWFQGLPERITSALSTLGAVLGNIATTAWNSFLQAAQTAWQGVQTWFTTVPGNISNALSTLGSTLSGIAATALGSFLDACTTAAIGILTWFKGLPGQIKNALTSLRDRLGEAASTAWSWFSSVSSTAWTTFITWVKGLPQAAKNALTSLRDRIGEAASTAWSWFSSVSSTAWTTFITWVQGLPQAAKNAITSLRDRLGEAASTAWGWFSSTSSTAWTTFITWVKGLPQNLYNNIIGIKDKLVTAAQTAFQGLKDKASTMVDGKGGFMEWVRGIPGKVASALGNIGSSVAESVRKAWNGMATWIDTHGIDNINKVIAVFNGNPHTLPHLPTFARGGMVPGAPSKTDNVLAALRSGEGVLVPEAVAAIGGKRGIDALNQGDMSALKKAGLPGFADGGILGTIGSAIGSVVGAITGAASSLPGVNLLEKGLGFALNKIMAPLPGLFRAAISGDSLTEQIIAGSFEKMITLAKSWGDKTGPPVSSTPGQGMAGGGNALANQKLAQSLLPLFGFGPDQMGPLIALWTRESGWSQTASNGNTGPDSGSAYGIPQSMPGWKMASVGADWRTNPVTQIRWGLGYIRTEYGSPAVANAFQAANNGYDNGGWMLPGQGGMNSSRKPEPVFNAGQWATLSSLVGMSANILKSATMAGNVAGMSLRGSALVNAQSKLRGYSAPDTTQTSAGNGGGNEYHFHGDLSFPNIKNGEDAEVFLKNLKSLAGGK